MLPMKPSNRQPSPSEQTLQFPARYTLKYCFFLTHLYTRWHRALLAMLVKLYFFKPTVLRHIKATWRSPWFESFSLRCLEKGCSLCGPLITVVTICKSPILWEKTNRTEVDTFWSDLLFIRFGYRLIMIQETQKQIIKRKERNWRFRFNAKVDMT